VSSDDPKEEVYPQISQITQIRNPEPDPTHACMAFPHPSIFFRLSICDICEICG